MSIPRNHCVEHRFTYKNYDSFCCHWAKFHKGERRPWWGRDPSHKAAHRREHEAANEADEGEAADEAADEAVDEAPAIAHRIERSEQIKKPVAAVTPVRFVEQREREPATPADRRFQQTTEGLTESIQALRAEILALRPVELIEHIPPSETDAEVDAQIERAKRRHEELETREHRIGTLRAAVCTRLDEVAKLQGEQHHYNRANMGALVLEKESRKRRRLSAGTPAASRK